MYSCSHPLIEAVAQLGDSALDLIKLAALLPSVSLSNIHGIGMMFVDNINTLVCNTVLRLKLRLNER